MICGKQGFENDSLKEKQLHSRKEIIVGKHKFDQTHLAHLIRFNKLDECKIQYKNYKK